MRSIQVVEKLNIWQYRGNTTSKFLKLVMALPSMVATARGILERGLEIPGHGALQMATFESNILFNLRYGASGTLADAESPESERAPSCDGQVYD